MYKTIAAAIALTGAALSVPAYAQDEAESDIKITGNVSLTSQYRLRGISQTEEKPAIQGGITVAHSSGFYVGTWASNLSGFGSFGGNNMELDLIAGYSKAVGDVTLDGGVVFYVYPGGSIAVGEGDSVKPHFFDIYGAVSFPAGPINTKLAVYYAPDDSALGGNDNLWVYGDFAFPITDTPVTLKAHIGYTDGALGGPSGKYLDYSVGADFTYKNLTLNVSYIDTDISRSKVVRYGWGGTYDIVDGAIVATLTAAF